MKYLSICFSVVVALSMVACGSNKTEISGKFTCENNKTIYLEQLMLGTKITVDSATISKRGDFNFTYKFIKNTDPVFLNLRVGEKYLSLLAAPGENIKVNSHSNFVTNYDISGSEGSLLVKELNTTMARTYSMIDSLYNIYNFTTDEDERQSLLIDISKLYIEQKKSNIRFLVTNPRSLASLMALYQQMPNGIRIFADEKDFQYFKLIADTLSAYYPTSLNVKSLVKDVQEYEGNSKVINMLSSTLDTEALGTPDIVVNDMYDKPQRLSDQRGKVVLLTFWSAQAGNSNVLNRELLEVYEQYADAGFEIFQVSLDTSKSAWVAAIMEQKLPWISVCDFYGASSSAAAIYNVKSVPSNYLISRDGDIIGKDIWGNDLTTKLKGAL